MNKMVMDQTESVNIQMALKVAKDKRSTQRLLTILGYFDGRPQCEIAKMLNIDVHTVGKYVKKYQAGGINALLERKFSPGKPRRLTPEQENELVKVITEHTPDEVGFEPRKNWNLGIIRAWIFREYGVEYSQSGMADALHRLNLSYTMPTYTLKKADPEKQEIFVNEFEIIKKLVEAEEIHHVLFEDESMIRAYQAVGKTWFVKGKQRIVPTYGKHEGVKLVGVLNYETGEVYCEEHEKYDAEVFLGFLKNVTNRYATGKIVMILDNARIHHAKLLQSYLDEVKDRLKLVFLPPYSPNLNPIEGLWKWLKAEVINNVFFPHVSKIQQAVRAFMKYIEGIPSTVIDRLCVRM